MDGQVNHSGDCWVSPVHSPTRRKVTVIPHGQCANEADIVTIPLDNMQAVPAGTYKGCMGVTVHDVSYEISQRKCCIKKPNKKILNSVSGHFGSGLNAIMGPTGSGKTSLLDIIAGRKGKSGLSGTVLVNGNRQPDNFKCASGYVVQDDRLMGTLSVKENLYFSAALRLPNSIPWSEKRRRVQKIIEDLGLTSCCDTKVGNEFFRGVSGGERKRTNIGMELIIEPQVLFLDEPTTGLDAFTAVSVIKLLKGLCKGNDRVIIMAIHQPRYSIFKLFDTLTLLSRGDVIYHGQAYGAINYFSELGDPVEEHDNPADHFLDVLIASEKAMDAQDLQQQTQPIEMANKQDKAKVINLVDHYTTSSEYKALRSTIDPVLNELERKENENGVLRQRFNCFGGVGFATGFFWQLLIVGIRSMVNILRNPTTSVFQLAFNLGFGLAIGIIYFQLDLSENGARDRLGVIFFIITNSMFGSLSSIDVFIEQRAQFFHENTSGYYRLSAFYISKIFTDLVPVKIVTLSAFAVACYFLLGFQLAADRFFIFLLVLWLISLCASSLGLMFGAAVGVSGVAQLLIATSFVLSMMFGGFFVAINSLPEWIRWLQYLSIVRYAMEALAVNELNGLTFGNSSTTATTGTTMPLCMFTGQQQLMILGFNVDWLWYDVLAIAGFTVLFLIFAYVALLIKTTRR